MFDTHSDYALNKMDKNAIICPCASGEHIRLVREDFSSEEEFLRWKKWSDDNYHEAELASQKEDRCFPLEAQQDTPALSAEDAILVPHITAEQAERRGRMLEQFKKHLTAKQYRRLCFYYLEGKNEREIAQLEGVGQQRISKSITSGRKVIENFFKEFLSGRG